MTKQIQSIMYVRTIQQAVRPYCISSILNAKILFFYFLSCTAKGPISFTVSSSIHINVMLSGILYNVYAGWSKLEGFTPSQNKIWKLLNSFLLLFAAYQNQPVGYWVRRIKRRRGKLFVDSKHIHSICSSGLVFCRICRQSNLWRWSFGSINRRHRALGSRSIRSK